MIQYEFSAPGRTELAGNHTDHQDGCVLAAAVDLQTRAVVTCNDENVLRVHSEGYAPVTISLADLSPHTQERHTTAALVRGVAAAFHQRGCTLHGLDLRVTSEVLPGAGLSSSAAFEVLLGVIFNKLFFDGKLPPLTLAAIGQEAERTYFGKPCGLMDQAASALGGAVFLDFENPTRPRAERLEVSFADAGYTLCVIHTGDDHCNLTDDYAAIGAELGEVCRYFGRKTLRQVSAAQFYAVLPQLRGSVPDRALLRAMHVYEENTRVMQQADALRRKNFPRFFELVRRSGQSSWMYLQNVIPSGSSKRQSVALALALCERSLAGEGAFRVHGGGFAGTVQAYVPSARYAQFCAEVEAVFGAHSCQALGISHDGGRQIS